MKQLSKNLAESDDCAVFAEKLGKKFSGNYLNPFMEALFGRKIKEKNDFQALQDVSFRIKKGESVGILGENGSGKSTLLQLVAKTLSPTSGLLFTEGKLAALLELGSGFNPDFTGRENVYLNASILGLSRSRINQIFDQIIDFAEIGDFADRPVSTYSSGMRVRLGFAVSVFVEPDILIIDEALSVGDVFFRKRCFEVISKHSAKGGTLLFVTHNEEQLRLFSRRVIVLHRGRIIFDGETDEAINLYNEHMGESRRAYFSTLSADYSTKKKLNGKRKNTAVTSVQIEDLGGLVRNDFRYGEKITIRVEAKVGHPFKCLHFGILIRNKEGINIYSTETEGTDFQNESNCWNDMGINACASFVISSPVGKNSYNIEAYIVDRADRFSEKIDWVSNTAYFNVDFPMPHEETRFKGGIVDLQAVKHISFSAD